MPLSINWASKVITVPTDYLTPLGNNTYQLDLQQFHLDLRDLEDDPEGIPFPVTHSYVGPALLAGTVYAPQVSIINGYTVDFDNAGMNHYTVNCTGANHNLADVKVQDSVSLIVNNAAGLVIGTGSDPAAIAAAVWAAATTAPAPGSYGAWVQKLLTVAKFLGLK